MAGNITLYTIKTWAVISGFTAHGISRIQAMYGEAACHSQTERDVNVVPDMTGRDARFLLA